MLFVYMSKFLLLANHELPEKYRLLFILYSQHLTLCLMHHTLSKKFLNGSLNWWMDGWVGGCYI